MVEPFGEGAGFFRELAGVKGGSMTRVKHGFAGELMKHVGMFLPHQPFDNLAPVEDNNGWQFGDLTNVCQFGGVAQINFGENKIFG